MDVIAHETSEQLSRALGDAVVRIWGRVPPDLQRGCDLSGRNDETAPNHLSASEAPAHMRCSEGPRNAGAGQPRRLTVRPRARPPAISDPCHLFPSKIRDVNCSVPVKRAPI